MNFSPKDLDLSENPVADKRLLKLIQQCRTKQVLDYVKQHGEDAPKSAENGSTQNQKSSKSKKSKKSESSDTEPNHKFNVKRHTSDTVKVLDQCVFIIISFFKNFYFNFINFWLKISSFNFFSLKNR